MTFSWRDLYTFSYNLYQDPNNPGPSEAALRASISRAYYSAFHLSCKFATDRGYKIRKNHTNHMKVLQFLHDAQDIPANLVSIDLERLHEFRLKADYSETITEDIHVISYAAIKYADHIIKTIDANPYNRS